MVNLFDDLFHKIKTIKLVRIQDVESLESLRNGITFATSCNFKQSLRKNLDKKN